MNGEFREFARSHLSTHVLQTCYTYGSNFERERILKALQPDLLALSREQYTVPLVKRLLDKADKNQLTWFISALRGQVVSCLRCTAGYAVIEYLYKLLTGSEKQRLLVELYYTELDVTKISSTRLVDVVSEIGLQKPLVVQHINSLIQSLLEKGAEDFSILHTLLVEFFTVADKTSATCMIQQLLPFFVQSSCGKDKGLPSSSNKKNKMIKIEPFIVRMINTRDGLRLGILCIKHGSAEDRLRIIEGIKDHIKRIAKNKNGSLLLACILSVVEDTELLTKIVVQPIQAMAKELVIDRTGRNPFLQLLQPLSSYFGQDDLRCLSLSVRSMDSEGYNEKAVAGAGGKKDPFYLRRRDLLFRSGLAESLIATCIENANDLLHSKFGTEFLHVVAIGGTDGVLNPLVDKVENLQKRIVALAALPNKSSKSEKDEHVLMNTQAIRTIRALILDSPSFASSLWKNALEGKCEMWASGCSSKKVLTAFLESTDPNVRGMAKRELQGLIDRGVLVA